MNLEIANKAIKAAICASESINVKSNIAVVDAGANLVAFARMDNSPLGTVDISIKKAKTAALFQVSSGHKGYSHLKQYNGVDFKDFIPVRGGVPIFDGKNVLIGGIGVSSRDDPDDSRSSYDTGYNDESIANAGKNAAK